MTKPIGKKEAEIRALREETADDIPDFLKRTETPEQAEKRRAKYKPKDSTGGLKVKKLPEPVDPAIAKAIKKDLKDDVTDIPWAEMTGKDLKTTRFGAAILPRPTDRPRGAVPLAKLSGPDLARAAKEAAEDQGLIPKKKTMLDAVMKGEMSTGDALTKIGGFPKTTRVEAKPKKVGKLVARALAARDALAQKASKAKEHDMAKSKTKPQPAKAAKGNGKGRYDWTGAEENAAQGKLPPPLDFSANTHKSYRGKLDEVEKMVKAKNLKALRAWKPQRQDGSPLMIDRWRKLAIKALEAK
jgi:hypothetical protein